MCTRKCGRAGGHCYRVVPHRFKYMGPDASINPRGMPVVGVPSDTTLMRKWVATLLTQKGVSSNHPPCFYGADLAHICMSTNLLRYTLNKHIFATALTTVVLLTIVVRTAPSYEYWWSSGPFSREHETSRSAQNFCNCVTLRIGDMTELDRHGTSRLLMRDRLRSFQPHYDQYSYC